MCDDFVELRGDRTFEDSRAVVAGLARFRGRTVALVGHQKGRTLEERYERSFGMPYPEGYRKAMRTMELADRHGFPLLTLVDTPGAYPGVRAEQHGQGGWIARCQLAMAGLEIPTVACVIGEGGSGGAVAIAIADRVLMQENAIYSVISPEGCAAILWRDASEAKKAAAAFKPDARHCLELGVIDGIVAEPGAGAHEDHDAAATLLADGLETALGEVSRLDAAERRRDRRGRFRAMGVFSG
jgi:acetyl-CoA carboxylase carboxyl transferase subunit alpha